jgi:protein ImuA
MRFASAPPPDFLPRDFAPAAPLRRWASGCADIDAVLGGGFAYGRLHEFYAAEAVDVAAAAGFVGAVASGLSPGTAVLWVRSERAARVGGVVQANGLNELSVAGHGLVSVVPDSLALLRTALEALRCAALGAVIVEGWGTMRELDLTASRRLALAAAKSGVSLLMLRVEAEPVPSSAQTRWRVAAAPSRALPGNAPGRPCFEIELLRQRSGPFGLGWQVEWDRDRGKFREASSESFGGALSGAVVSVPAGGAVAGTGRAGARVA